MTIIPALEQELFSAASRPIPAPRVPVSRRRRLLHGLPVVAISLAVAGGGAYAARGLWMPELGNDGWGHATATATRVPVAERDILGILRRPQTAADRDADVRHVLQALSKESGEIRTNDVRRLPTLPNGVVPVLVPVRAEKGYDPTLPNAPRNVLTIGFTNPATGVVTEPSLPADALGVRAGNMMIQIGRALTPHQRALSDAFLAREHRAGRLRTYPGTPVRYGVMSVEQGIRWHRALGIKETDPAWYVGVVPDEVRRVQVGDRPPVAVKDNFFIADTIIGEIEQTTWFDKDGDVVPFASTAGAWQK